MQCPHIRVPIQMSQRRLCIFPQPPRPWSVRWRAKRAFPQVPVNTVAPLPEAQESQSDVSGNYSSATCSKALVGVGPCGMTVEGSGSCRRELYLLCDSSPAARPPGASTYPVVSQAVKVDNAAALENLAPTSLSKPILIFTN